MEIVFTDTLKEVFSKTFGVKDSTLPQAPVRIEQSSQGVPYYADDSFGREFFMPIWLDNYLVPFAVMGVNCKKNIVSTPMPMRGGSVHELINIDDYSFNIKGLIINGLNQFPEADMIAIQNIFVKNKSVTLRSVMSDIFLDGERMVTINEIKWPGVAAVEHAKPFEIVCESDMSFVLEIEE